MTTIPDRQTDLTVIEQMLFAEPNREDRAGMSDRELALSALRGLNAQRADEYRSWILVGMALHAVDSSDSMRDEWDMWSRTSEKYKSGECESKWAGFDTNGKVTIGTLMYWAKADGWTPPQKQVANKKDDRKSPGPNQTRPNEHLPWRAFPTQLLPGVAGRFVREAAAAIGCDETYVALPLLSVVAGTIGNRRSILLKTGWAEPCVIWTAIVGDSGTMKSPAIDAPLQPLRTKQSEEFKRNEEELLKHQADKMLHEAAVAAWKAKSKKGTDEPPPEPPVEPVCHRIWVSDTTVEAVAKVFQSAPCGLLLWRDELAGWLKSFDQYKGGKGGDTAHWLTMHAARDLLVDRKTTGTVYIRRAALSLTGGIQPAILRQALSREHFEDGLAARLLLSMAPRRPKRWTEAALSESVEAEFAELINRLHDLEPDQDDDGNPKPRVLPLTTAARALWIRFFDEHGDEQAACTGDLASAFSKLEGYAARLALVVQLIANPNSSCVDAPAMQAGIALSRWFMYECRRVYAALNETELESRRWRLIELIQRRNGLITVRDLTHADRQFAGKPDLAEAELKGLVERGYGVWEDVPTGPRGGRPTRAFRLHPLPEAPDCLRNPPDSAEKEGFGYGDGDSVPDDENEEVGEWTT